MEISDQLPHSPIPDKKQELKMFLFITIFLFPILSVCLVGGYGLLVWISQMIFGPPTGV